MKKTFSKSMAWILSVVMIFGVFVAMPNTANAFTAEEFDARISELKTKYPHMSVWGDNTYYENGAAKAWQCHGYAWQIAYEIFGSSQYTYNGGWTRSTTMGTVCAGDVVRVNNDGHTIFITKISGNTVYYTDNVDFTGYSNVYTGYHVRWDQTYSISELQNVFTYKWHYTGNNITPTPDPITYDYMTVGKKYYLKNNGTGKYMSIDNGQDVQCKNISVYQFTGHQGQQYEIVGSDTDRSYFLRPVLCQSSGRVVNVNGEYTSNGANVMIYNYTGHSTQQWKFRPESGGYAICSTNNLNICLTESNTNVQMGNYTGASNQIWTLEPVEHNHNYSEYVYNWAAHPHYKCYRCPDCGEVMENRNEPTYVDTCPDCIASARVDVGTDFYAYLINTSPWKMASVVGDGNVELESETGYSNQLWHFERQDDLYYIITNVKTNQCLDDGNFGTTNGTNVGVWNWNGTTAQKWAIIESNGGYELHPQCALNMALDVNGASSEDGANIQIWESHHGIAQIFTIYRYGNNPGTPELSISGNLFENEDVIISWNPCGFAHYYQVDIWHDGKHEQSFTTQNLSYTFEKLAAGDYGICVTSVNHNGRSNTATLDFTITNNSIAPTAKASFNGHTYEYYEKSLTWDQAYKFCEKKGGHLVTITSKEENDFLMNLVSGHTKSDWIDAWTGGRTFDHEIWFWITGETFNYTNWNDGEPNNSDNNEDAVDIIITADTSYNGKWNDMNGSNLSGIDGFICEYEDVDASKYTPVYKQNYNGHEYWFFEDKVDWQTAKKICAANGGYLAIPNNEAENTFILSGIKKTSKDEAWIGITDIAKEGTWRTVKGGAVSYTNWADGEPTNYLGIEDYVEMYSSGKWNDLRGFGPSYRSVGFVCEFDSVCVSGHQYVDKYVAATESETAHIIHKCSVCGYEWIESKTVSFETNGGTPVNDIDLLNKSVYGDLPVPTKDGYTFKGWSLTPVDTNSSIFTHDTAIYFQVPDSWGNVQTVFCHLWSSESEEPVYEWQSAQEVCENMGNHIYKFVIPSGTEANGVIFSTIEGYQTYDLALGTACENDMIYCIHQISSYSYLYEGAWKVNKEFKSIPSSWYDGEDLVNGMVDPATIMIDGYKFVNADTKVEQTGNHTLYAIWEIKRYTVSYDMNGGSGSISKQTKTHGKDLTLSATVPMRTDYKFIGWNTDKNAATAKYQPNGKYTANSNATLYAIWQSNHSYTTQVVAPTCTEKGYTLHTCTNCGDSYRDTYTDAAGHKYTEKVIAPTASAQGYTLHTCSVCGHSYKDNYTDMVFANTTSVSSESIDNGESVVIDASAVGGTAPYKFTIKFKKNSAQYWTLIQENSENKTVSFTLESKGVYTISVTASDSKGNTETKTFNVTVKEEAEPLSIEAKVADTLTLGDSLTITAKGSGGTGGYTYGVYYKKTTSETWSTVQPLNGTNTVITLKPSSAVKYDVCVKVRDTSGTVAKQYFTVTVVKKEIPLTNNSTISKTAIPLGESVTITAKATGGTAPYTYGVYYKKASSDKWTTAQSYKMNATISFKPGSAVKYDVMIKVKDNKGTIAKKTFTVTVTKELVNSSTVSATTVKKGQSVTVTAKASGGTGKYTYGVYYKKATSENWTTAQSYGTNNTVTIKPGAAVKYNICVKVKDSSGKIAKKYIDITCTK